MSEKNKILYFSAAPDDQEQLLLDTEFRRIFQNLDGKFDATSISEMKPADLVEALTRIEPDILHFSGHGSFGELFLENEAKKSSAVQKRDVVEIIQGLYKKPRLIFLNACWTAKNLQNLSDSVDFVIATRQKVPDPAAIIFAATFYKLLGNGQPVVNAFHLARNDLEVKKFGDITAMYELFVRKGADEGYVFGPASPEPEESREPKPEPVATKQINNELVIKDNQFGDGTTINQGNEQHFRDYRDRS